MKEETSRLPIWDNLKLILIVFVVLGHFSDWIDPETKPDEFRSLFLFIYSFHMPLFIFIAGLFHKNRSIGSKVFFYISAGFLLKVFLASTTRITGQINTGFLLLGDDSLPWFFFVLAYYLSITYALRHRNQKYILIATIVLACFIGYDSSIRDYLYLSRAILFYPFYLSGTMIGQSPIREKMEGTPPIWAVALALIALISWAYLCLYHLDPFYNYTHLFTGRHPFSDNVVSYGPIARVFCYMVSFVIGLAWIILIPRKRLPLLTNAGTHTIDVLFWHKIAFDLFVSPHLSLLYGTSATGNLLYLFMAIPLTLILALLPCFSFPLKQLKHYCYQTSSHNSESVSH